MTESQTIIVGGGLAGTTLAWVLHWRGQPVLLIDEPLSGSASRVAAGLVTPITGQRLVATPRFKETWHLALQTYRRVEQATQTQFFDQCGAVRIVRGQAESDLLTRRRSEQEFAELSRDPQPPVDMGLFHQPDGSLQMDLAGRLNVPAYLDASHAWFAQRGMFQRVSIAAETPLTLSPSGVELPEYGLSGHRLVFCQGIQGAANRWFPQIRFNPCRGELLTLSIPGLEESRTIHGSVWLAKQGNTFRCGATYDWTNLDPSPTAAARDYLQQQLRQFLKLPVEVLDQQAGIRPTTLDSQPVAVWHPGYPQLGCLNGLGSKGTLLAPLLAQQLADTGHFPQHSSKPAF